MKYSTNLFSINHHTNWSYSSSSFTRRILSWLPEQWTKNLSLVTQQYHTSWWITCHPTISHQLMDHLSPNNITTIDRPIVTHQYHTCWRITCHPTISHQLMNHLSPNDITPVDGSNYKIINSSILQEMFILQWRRLELRKRKVRQITGTWHQLPIFRPLLNFFVTKLKLRRKSSSFLLLGVTLTSYRAVAFKKSNIFYCVQGSNFADSDNQFWHSFQILLF